MASGPVCPPVCPNPVRALSIASRRQPAENVPSAGRDQLAKLGTLPRRFALRTGSPPTARTWRPLERDWEPCLGGAQPDPAARNEHRAAGVVTLTAHSSTLIAGGDIKGAALG
jgi:hypothetical protein